MEHNNLVCLPIWIISNLRWPSESFNSPRFSFHPFPSRETRSTGAALIHSWTVFWFTSSSLNALITMKKVKVILGETHTNILPVSKPFTVFFYVCSLFPLFVKTFTSLLAWVFLSSLSLLYTQIHLHSFLLFAVDMKMLYEYVCQRSKDIAYGEQLCIMQLFPSHLHSFRHTQRIIRSRAEKNRAINPSPSRSHSPSNTRKVNIYSLRIARIRSWQQVDSLCVKPFRTTDNGTWNAFRPNSSWSTELRGSAVCAARAQKYSRT